MLNTECKQCHKKWHHDNTKYCTMCGKKLVDEPEFKVGDYAVELGKYITKIEKISEYGIPVGAFYELENNHFCQSESTVASYEARHATPEEIAEYEAALHFYKHGREPFEVKRGDVVYLRGYDKNIFLDSGNIYKKHNFVDGDVVLVKTAEEIYEWLGSDDDK